MKCAGQIHFLDLCGIVAVVRCKCGGFLCNTNGVSACKRRFIVDDLRKKVGDIFAGFPAKGLFFSRNDLPEFRFKGVIPESCKFVIWKYMEKSIHTCGVKKFIRMPDQVLFYHVPSLCFKCTAVPDDIHHIGKVDNACRQRNFIPFFVKWPGAVRMLMMV